MTASVECVLVVFYPNGTRGAGLHLGRAFLLPAEEARPLEATLAAADVSALGPADVFSDDGTWSAAMEAGERLFGRLTTLAGAGRAAKTRNNGLCFLSLPPGWCITRVVNCGSPEDRTFDA